MHATQSDSHHCQQIHKEREDHKETVRQTDRQTDRETVTDTDTDRERGRDRQTERHTDRDKETDRDRVGGAEQEYSHGRLTVTCQALCPSRGSRAESSSVQTLHKSFE